MKAGTITVRRQKAAAIRTPYRGKHKRVYAAYNEDFQARAADPRESITTEMPDDVATALRKLTLDESAAVGSYYDGELPAIREEYQAEIEPVGAAFDALIAALDSPQSFEREWDGLAADCGRPLTHPRVDTVALVRDLQVQWQMRTARRLPTPKPATPRRPAFNLAAVFGK